MKTNSHRFALAESLLLLVALHPGLSSFHTEYRPENDATPCAWNRPEGVVNSISGRKEILAARKSAVPDDPYPEKQVRNDPESKS